MKKILKFSIFLSILFIFGFLSTETSFAASDDSNVSDVKLTITNDETGETTVVDDPVSTSNNESQGNLVKGYEFFAPIVNLKFSDFNTFDSNGGSKTGGGVTAKLNVDYDISSNGEKIRLNKVWGSWTPSDSMYYLTNRKVDAHSGSVWGKTLSKTPTSNSFSYTTGWGYNNFAYGQASPRAWTSAKIHVSGMDTVTYTLKLEITYP